MLIKQNQLLGEATSFLDSLEPLSLDEALFTPHQVSVRHNARLDQDLVQLESFLAYAQSNGIDDAGYALHRVCEANEVPRDSLAFLANEENLLEDDELLETFVQLGEAGFPVHVAPISDGSPYYLALLEALNLDQAYDTYEESPNLINYVNESIIDDAKDKISGFASSVKSKASSAVGTVKDKVKDGAKSIASKLASVRKEIAKKSAEMLKATGPAKVFIKRQIEKLKGAAKDLKSKLVSAKDAIGNKLSGAGKAVKDAASSVGSKFSGAADSIKSGVKNLGGKISGAASSVKSGLSNVGSKISDAAGAVKDKASSSIDAIKAKFA
jgi:uncharacterized protein YjbJ (UPF0337 family)